MLHFLAIAFLAVLSVWDYPARAPEHERLKAQFIEAVREGDTETMTETCKAGVALLPDDPVWHYNLACSLAYYADSDRALDELEEAIDLGFRDAKAIARDRDLKRVADKSRLAELVEYAEDMADKPILLGPNAVTPATGITGRSVAIGEQNVVWDFDAGCFDVKLHLAPSTAGGNTLDLYFNRDGGHSKLVCTNWPGLTPVVLDSTGRERGLDLDTPNMLFPYPVFGNCSRALTQGPYWRSLPRALMTTQCRDIDRMHRFYRSNQFWVFPAVKDYDFASTNSFGDVFNSVAPYWIATQGASWSDQYYLRAALEASRSFQPLVKRELVERGLLAPTIQWLIRSSLQAVKKESDYFTERAHPTVFPPNGLDLKKLKKSAAALKTSNIPPVATIAGIAPEKVDYAGTFPELTYATPCAWAFVLRAEAPKRSFIVKAAGADEYEFAVVHDDLGAATLSRLAPDVAKIELDCAKISPGHRVDLAVFGKSVNSAYGAPAFVSFSRVDPAAPYSDPFLTPLPQPATEAPASE